MVENGSYEKWILREMDLSKDVKTHVILKQDDPRRIRSARRSVAILAPSQHETIPHLQEDHTHSNGSQYYSEKAQRRSVSEQMAIRVSVNCVFKLDVLFD